MKSSLKATFAGLLSLFIVACIAPTPHAVNPLSSADTYAAFNRTILEAFPPGGSACQVQDVVLPFIVAREGSINTTRIYRCEARQVAILISFDKSSVKNHRNASTRQPGRQYDEFPVIGGHLVFEWPDPNGEGHAVHLFGDDAVMVIGISGVKRTEDDATFIRELLGQINLQKLQEVVSGGAT